VSYESYTIKTACGKFVGFTSTGIYFADECQWRSSGKRSAESKKSLAKRINKDHVFEIVKITVIPGRYDALYPIYGNNPAERILEVTA